MPSTFDPARLQFAVKADAGLTSDPSPLVAYGQEALNRLPGLLPKPLAIDGRHGPKTMAAVKKFQTHQEIPVTGIFDRLTWYHLDWCVYDGWTPAPATCTSAGPNGLAIVNGCNKYTGDPVNTRGLTREAQRLADVTNWLAPVDFRPNFAVDRDQRGNPGNLSNHALGIANDDMTDLDRDRVLEPAEYAQCDTIADQLIARTTGWPAQYGSRNGKLVAFVGPDRLATAVWTNHRMPDGTWRFPLTLGVLGRGDDYSWTPPRRTWKRGRARVHYNHLHLDVITGAPKWVA